METASIGARVKRLLEQRTAGKRRMGEQVDALGAALDVHRSFVYRLLRDEVEWTEKYVAAAAKHLGLSEPELRYGTTPPPSGAGAEAGAGEQEASLVDSVPRSADYWLGRQDALLEMMLFAADLQRQAAEWQGRTIRAQRELVANTVPTPRTDLTEEQRKTLEKAQGLLEALGKARHAQPTGAGAEPPAPPAGARPPRRAGGSGG